MGEAFDAPSRVSRHVPGESVTHPVEPFFRGLGHFAITRHDALWYTAGRFTLVTFPNNRKVACTKRDIQRLLVDCGKLVAVFCPLAGSGVRVVEHRLPAGGYGPGRLQEQFRRHVRKHAAAFVTRPLGWDEMAAAAGPIHADTAARRGNPLPALTDRARWQAVCSDAAGIPGLEAYGCLLEDRLAAYVVSWQERDTCHGVLINRDGTFDARRVANVLLHAFSVDRTGRPDVAEVNLGRGWYPPRPSLDSFKRHAGYDEREMTLAVVLHPRLEWLLASSLTHRFLKTVARLAGGRLDLESDLRLFEAARRTDIP